MYDRDHRITNVNIAASEFLACAPLDLVGKRNAEIDARFAADIEPVLNDTFANGFTTRGRVVLPNSGEAVRVVARAENDEVVVVLHRIAADSWMVERPRADDVDVANQLLTFHTDHSPLGVIRWDSDFRIVGWSSRAETIFGWSFVNVYGKTFAELNLVHPDDRAVVARSVIEFQQGNIEANAVENRNVTRDGRVIHARWFNSRIRMGSGFGVLSLVEDISDTIASRGDAEESEQRFRSLFDYSADPMLSLALDGTITRANEAAAKNQRTTMLEMIGRPIGQFIESFDVARFMAALTDAAQGTAGTIEVAALRAGAPYPIAASFIPIVLRGRISGVHFLARDLSAAKRAERDVATHSERIRELYLVSAAANVTAEEQIVATMQAGCRLLNMSHSAIFDAAAERSTVHVGASIPARISKLTLGTDGALALEDIAGIPFFGETRSGEGKIGSLISTAIDVGGSRYGTLTFADPQPREPFAAVDCDLVQLMGVLIASALERGRARAHLKHLAYNDQLTGLPNRASFVERLRVELAEAATKPKRVGVMFLDLDRFKDINDTLGHVIGDSVLRQAGERLSDAVGTDGLVARMGGDEFIVMLTDDPDAERLETIARRLVNAIDQPFLVEGYEQYLTTSVGIALYPHDGGDGETLIKHADIAMYRAKERGRNTFHFFTPALNAALRTRLSQEKSLRKALDGGEFVVFYQPQIDMPTNAVVCVEALVRWEHPRLGMITPDQFIPSAEISGLIVALGDWVLETACAQVARWQRNGHPDLRLAVNLSARQFHQSHLAEKVRASARRAAFPTDMLELEITETVAMTDGELTIQVMRALREAGIRLSVDDFGTGYSSLGYLRRFPLNSVKIDRSFVQDIMTEPDDATIVRTVIRMAHSLGLEVVAEGVETAEQLAFLREEGCDRVQGWHFAKALSATDATRYLDRHAAPRVGAVRNA